jgi:hypothetical protein
VKFAVNVFVSGVLIMKALDIVGWAHQIVA